MITHNKNPIPFLIVMNMASVLFALIGGLMILVAGKDLARLQVFFTAGIMLLCTSFIILGLVANSVWGPNDYKKAWKNFRR